MDKKNVWAGLDVSKEKFDAAVVRGGCGEAVVLGERVFPRDRKGADDFVLWAEGLDGTGGGGLRVVMESTGRYSGELAGHLEAAGFGGGISIVNPRLVSHHIKSLGVSSRTDKADARGIASYGMERRPRRGEKKAPSREKLGLLVRARADLSAMRTAMINRLEKEGSDEIRKSLEKEIAALDAKMRSLAEADEELRKDAELLGSIPGTGPVNTMTILGEIGDLRRFSKRGQLAAFVGLNPVVKESGSSVRKKCGISKAGSPEARRVPHLAARAAVRAKKRNRFQLFYERKVREGKSKLCALTAVMRMILLTARAILIKGEPFMPSPS